MAAGAAGFVQRLPLYTERGGRREGSFIAALILAVGARVVPAAAFISARDRTSAQGERCAAVASFIGDSESELAPPARAHEGCPVAL